MKRLLGIVVDSIWLACLYYGLAQGVEGALNVGLFMTWFMFVFSFGAFSKEVVEVIGQIPAWAIARSMAFDVAAIGMLAWHGWIITAAAVAWTFAIGFSAWQNGRKGKSA